MWILGHLAYIESLVIRKFMQGEDNPLADWETSFDGDAVSSDKNDFPSFNDCPPFTPHQYQERTARCPIHPFA